MNNPDSTSFVQPLQYTIVEKIGKGTARESALRGYCSQSGTTWCLQVRGPLRRADGSDGADFIVASASCSADDLRALQAWVNTCLADVPVTQPDPAEVVDKTNPDNDTFLVLAAVADAAGLPMLACQFAKAHGDLCVVHTDLNVSPARIQRALQTVVEAETVWRNAEVFEHVHGRGPDGDVGRRIGKAMYLLMVARMRLGERLAESEE